MSKILVSYFSATGITKGVAEKIGEFLKADLFEIEPSITYTPEDLDWTDSTSRSTLEMKDNTSRPRIKNKIINMNNYDTILIGFPVWWYTAPRIINTFIEENDLKNKKIYVFVTSGSSSLIKSFDDLKNTYLNLNFISGKRFIGNEDKEYVKNWIK